MGCTQCICNRWRIHDISSLPESVINIYGVYSKGSGSCGVGTKERKHLTLIDANGD